MSVEEIKAQYETNGAFMVTSSSTSANDSLIVEAKTFLPTVWILDLGGYLVKNFSYYESNI
jgi:hypothetical protein